MMKLKLRIDSYYTLQIFVKQSSSIYLLIETRIEENNQCYHCIYTAKSLYYRRMDVNLIEDSKGPSAEASSLKI